MRSILLGTWLWMPPNPGRRTRRVRPSRTSRLVEKGIRAQFDRYAAQHAALNQALGAEQTWPCCRFRLSIFAKQPERGEMLVNVDRILTVACLTEAPDEVKLEDGEV
jgi:hypothetical protein